MDLIKVVDNLSADMYLRLKLAVETGKWPEGTEVAAQQRESALQLVMAYQSRVLKSDEMMTVGADGNIVNKSKKELQTQFAETNTLNSNDIARFSKL